MRNWKSGLNRGSRTHVCMLRSVRLIEMDEKMKGGCCRLRVQPSWCCLLAKVELAQVAKKRRDGAIPL